MTFSRRQVLLLCGGVPLVPSLLKASVKQQMNLQWGAGASLPIGFIIQRNDFASGFFIHADHQYWLPCWEHQTYWVSCERFPQLFDVLGFTCGRRPHEGDKERWGDPSPHFGLPQGRNIG